MKTFEIDIQLDPVNDGANWIPEKMRCKDRGALIVGTNGKYRFAEEEEAMEVFDKLSGICASGYMGKTEYLIVYNSKKVLSAGTNYYLAGSAMIVKGTVRGIELLTQSEMEEALKEFESRLVTLCGSGIQFSAYEIG